MKYTTVQGVQGFEKVVNLPIVWIGSRQQHRTQYKPRQKPIQYYLPIVFCFQRYYLFDISKESRAGGISFFMLMSKESGTENFHLSRYF